jgi:hypothetical protein
LYITGP